MKIFDRLTVLVKADAHGVLEQLEEKSLLAKQHLREAELELNRKRVQCEALSEESRRLEEEAQRLERECASLDEDVRLALEGGKEDLARFSIRRILPRRRNALELRERIGRAEDERERLRAVLETQQATYDALEQRVRTLVSAERAGEARPEPCHVANEEVELELLRRRAGAEAAQ